MTHTIGGGILHQASTQSGKSWRTNIHPLRSKTSRMFDKGIERVTTTMRGSHESLVHDEAAFGNVYSEMDFPGRLSRPFSMVRPLTSMTVHSETETTITGGGRQRWEAEDGRGRWEGFGGVIKTVEIEVSSHQTVSPTDPTSIVEFGRGLTRRDEWAFPSPPRTSGVCGSIRRGSIKCPSIRSRAASKTEQDGRPP